MHRIMVLSLVVLLTGGVYIVAGTGRAILDDGDALYATAAREMLARGDLVVPYANGVRFLDKPPLMYWLMAASYKVFGVTEFAARFPSILAVLGCASLLYLMVRKAAGDLAGISAALAMALCVGTFLFTRNVFPDMLFVFFLTLAMFGFMEWYARGPVARWPAPLFYAGCAGAVLTKGLIGLVFPVAIVLIFMLVSGEVLRLRSFAPVTGGLLFVALSAPWHLLAAQRTRGFLWYYFVNEHFLRFLGRREPHDYHSIPVLLFWALVLVWMFPWSAFLPAASRLLRAGASQASSRALVRVSFVWVAVIGVFFSFSSRIEHYSMPIFPPLALLVGIALSPWGADESRSDASRLRWSGRGFAFLAVLGSIGASALMGAGMIWYLGQGNVGGEAGSRAHAYQYYFAPMYDLPQDIRERLKVPLAGAGIAISAGLLVAWLQSRRGRLRSAVLLLGATVGAFCLCAYQALGICEPVISSKQFAFSIRDSWRPGDRVIVVGDYESANSINFYTDARIEVYGGTAAVLEWGAHYPDAPKVILTREEFQAAWQGRARVFVLAADDQLPGLALGETHAILQSGGRTLLCNRPLQPRSVPADSP